ncbi:MAG TPA: hypothetical protein VJY35_04785 [Candidatus Eisenbacteria bacterium]|nr:hypothetical protein [Candidatus Eisenbacteria bacterium]
MKLIAIAIVFAAGAFVGCTAAGPPVGAQAPTSAPRSPAGSPFSDRAMGASSLGSPLILDRTDLRIGTTVQFNRIPDASELHDATLVTGLAHIVLALPFWPADFEPLRVLDNTPPEADVIVVLPGYPPNRAAAEAWNYINARLRIVVVVADEPPSSVVIGDLNTMRGLERVIAQMDMPSRYGFERLQRPLSFRKVVE